MGQAEAAVRNDVQASRPQAALSLSRAGVTGAIKTLRVRLAGQERELRASIDCYAELSADQRGVHMSRFEEVVNEALQELPAAGPLELDMLAEALARQVRAAQGATRAEVTIDAEYPLVRATPVTGLQSQENYRLTGVAAATAAGGRRMLGATAQGMNACPCAQGLIAEQAVEALAASGFDAEEIERALAAVPVATHNQRARGTLLIGADNGLTLDPGDLIAIIEDSMSSEIYELMKRPDEQWVVAKAHRRPRFVEDSVREMLRGVVERFPELGDDAFVSARQLNFETIHVHDVEAQREATLGEIRAELAGAPITVPQSGLREWLGRASGGRPTEPGTATPQR